MTDAVAFRRIAIVNRGEPAVRLVNAVEITANAMIAGTNVAARLGPK